MAIENRQFITLDEIVGIQYACKSCGASVSIPRKQWPMVQHDCPAHCDDGSGVGKHAEWIERRGPEEQNVITLQRHINDVTQAEMGCTISFEIGEPLS